MRRLCVGFTLSVLLSFLAFALPADAAPVTPAGYIDTFDYGMFTIIRAPGEDTGDAVTPNEPPVTGVLGGKRSIFVANDAASAGDIEARLIVDDEAFKPGEVPLTFHVGDGNKGQMRLEYGPFPTSHDLLNIPGQNAKWDRLVINFEPVGNGDNPITNEGTVTIFLFGNGQSSAVTKPALRNGGELSFPYADFFAASPSFTTDSLRNLDAAQLQIDAADGDSYRLDFFGAGGFVPNQGTPIPLPAALSAAPAVMALAAVAHRRLRRA